VGCAPTPPAHPSRDEHRNRNRRDRVLPNERRRIIVTRKKKSNNLVFIIIYYLETTQRGGVGGGSSTHRGGKTFLAIAIATLPLFGRN